MIPDIALCTGCFVWSSRMTRSTEIGRSCQCCGHTLSDVNLASYRPHCPRCLPLYLAARDRGMFTAAPGSSHQCP